MTISFTVLGQPVAKARPRTGRGRIYTPAKTTAAESAIRAAWIDAGAQTFSGPVAVCIVFAMRRPKRGEAAYPMARPDIDNLIKTVLDGLNPSGVCPGAWHDDARVTCISAQKLWASGDPGTTITIRQVGQ